MRSDEVRESFLQFFQQRGHRIVPSSPLIPRDDPTLLFANAGMNQFKGILLGKEERDYKRAASCQKCLRVSGKHNDLEEVGRDGFHHTFFEMLGNWSFGDYYKEEAIGYAWDYTTRILGLSPQRLWVSVYQDDEEAYRLWKEGIGIPERRILRLGEKENFWMMGEVGPCGPCAEIYYDFQPEAGNEFTPDGERFSEIWNLVFIQFNREPSGELSPLTLKSVDTGMGLERAAAVTQGVRSNYQTDLFRPLMDWLGEISSDGELCSQRVISDHIRALSFSIAEGIIPSNEGGGYVIRRILRRAARHGRLLGLKEPFLYKLSSLVVDLMGKVYPELDAKREHIALVIKAEEERFGETLDLGMGLFSQVAKGVKGQGGIMISGQDSFKLYDTYGFPLDLIQVMAKEEGLEVDLEGFNLLMEAQREKARKASSFVPGEDVGLKGMPPTKFLGYETLEAEGKIVWLKRDGESLELALDQTPFYAAQGGQVGDRGRISAPNLKIGVEDTIRMDGATIHLGRVELGQPREGMVVTAQVDKNWRKGVERSHTATHLLQAALRRVLGDHIHQSGSLVEPDRLRFDFTHFKGLGSEEIQAVESLINEKIREDLKVETNLSSFKEAQAQGAIALFGEKYGERVRVVRSGDFSLELCGGTHLQSTGQIGYFRLDKEEGIAAGIRRIEARVGEKACRLAREEGELLGRLSVILKSEPADLEERVRRLLQERAALQKETQRLMGLSHRQLMEEMAKNASLMNGIKVVCGKVEARSREELLQLADVLRGELESGVGLLGTALEGKPALLLLVTRDLVSKRGLKAGELVREVASLMGGKGGGSPHLAQAGGGDIDKLDEALEGFPAILKGYL
jgi:alanyl-tRNA synthetase